MLKINSAESIRGLACIAVVISHLSLVFFPYLHNFEKVSPQNEFISFLHHSPFGFMYSGTAAVYIFFVLSGFVLSLAILRNGSTNKKIFSMCVKRYPRLAIPTFFSCIFMWFILRLYTVNTENVSSFIKKWTGPNMSLYEVLYQGSIGSFIFGDTSFNFVLWTMQIELFASFVVFLLLYVFKNCKLWVYIILTVILPIIFIKFSLQVFVGTISFILGMNLYLFKNHISEKFTIPALIIGLYFAGVHNDSLSYLIFIKYLGNKTYIILNFLAGFLIVYGVLFNSKISKFLDNKFLVYLGKLSFSIYLIHIVFIYMIGIPILNILLKYNFSYILSSLFAILVTLLVIYFVSIFYSRFIDELSIKASNKIESKISSNVLNI
ncbi:acyltransferase family protein [Acinetobacter nosocomialis]|uniref:acyltransferase family protein n=1 Tax=Acinetobacter nosocomialis TaxID=106654 RepID=UPI00396F30EA